MRTAREIVRRLRRRRITVQITKQAPYLGVDLGSGRRLARATRTKRMEPTRRQHGKIRKFAASSRRFKTPQKVERAGPQAGATYGHEVHGLPQRFILALRRRLGAVAGAHRHGRCLTTLLDLRAPGHDPGYQLPRKCLGMWLKVWLTEPRVRGPVHRVWRDTVTKLQKIEPRHRARHVRGPLTAVIHYLLQANWELVPPTEWYRPAGADGIAHGWSFPDGLDGLDEATGLLDDFTHTLQLQQWNTASRGYCGSGMEGGVDNFSYRRFLYQLEQLPHGKRLAELMMVIAVGCDWPAEWKRDEGYSESGLCPRCGNDVETPLHIYYTCPCNSDAASAAFALSNQLWSCRVVDFHRRERNGFNGSRHDRCVLDRETKRENASAFDESRDEI